MDSQLTNCRAQPERTGPNVRSPLLGGRGCRHSTASRRDMLQALHAGSYSPPEEPPVY